VFHPLAYLVKLNIEMSMARLIKKIALGSENPHNAAGFRSFNSTSHADKGQEDGSIKTWAAKQGASFKSIFGSGQSASAQQGGIKKTEEFTVRSAPREEVEMEPHKYVGDKSVQIGISSVSGQEHADSGQDFKDSKASRLKQCMSDEETLIASQPPPSPFRRSTDSSAKASDISADPRVSYT
jgi:hypothetical protein